MQRNELELSKHYEVSISETVESGEHKLEVLPHPLRKKSSRQSRDPVGR